jgi:hypothetical protein
MPGVYISHSVNPWELAQVYTLAQETERQGLPTFIPDRNWLPSDGLPTYLLNSLSQSDILLAFITQGGHYIDWVNLEMQAVSQNAKIVALIEQGIQVTGIDPRNIVEFNRNEEISPAVEDVTRILQGFRLQQPTGNLLTGLVLGGLVLLILRGLARGR